MPKTNDDPRPSFPAPMGEQTHLALTKEAGPPGASSTLPPSVTPSVRPMTTQDAGGRGRKSSNRATRPRVRGKFPKLVTDADTLQEITRFRGRADTPRVKDGRLYEKPEKLYVAIRRGRPPRDQEGVEYFKLVRGRRGRQSYWWVSVRRNTRMQAILKAAYERDGRNYYDACLLHYVILYLAGQRVPPGFEVHHGDNNHWNNKFANLFVVLKGLHQDHHDLQQRLDEERDDVLGIIHGEQDATPAYMARYMATDLASQVDQADDLYLVVRYKS